MPYRIRRDLRGSGDAGAPGTGIGRLTETGWEGDTGGEGTWGTPGQGGGGGGGRRAGSPRAARLPREAQEEARAGPAVAEAGGVAGERTDIRPSASSRFTPG